MPTDPEISDSVCLMIKLATIILAAGKGTRMKSDLVKVLHPLMGRPMLAYAVDTSLEGLKAGKTVVVVGHHGEKVQKALSEDRLTFVSQHPQLGSGHAVLCARDAFRDYEGTILILSGDVPLVRGETLKALASFHQRQKATLTIGTTRLPDPTGYGRIVRGEGAWIERIIEERDASPEECDIDEINTGLYCVEAPFLFDALKRVGADNQQREYYLTDIVEIGCHDGRKVLAFEIQDSEQLLGINTRIDLAQAHQILRKRCLDRWMLAGVTITDPATTYIETPVTVGQDTMIYPNSTIQGKTMIGRRCIIGPNCLIADSELGDDVTVKAFSTIEESQIKRGAVIGPFSRLRPQSQILENAKVGNFVEIKKSVIGRESKANHLAYIGDTTLGERTNIGAGTITCNYDGTTKHPTIIGNEVFVGSNTELIAPVRIGDRAVIGAGSTITRDVPEGSLAVSRTKQSNINRWQKRRPKKK
jgi:bifunctional UDP-N-acetylglucosamine pyrophosphorylase/glucosamine-1-phosphate N-acetyltransferase